MVLFLVIAALLVGVLIVVAVNPLLWIDYERRWTGIDRSRLVTDRAKFVATTRLAAILAIFVLVAFVFGVINFETVFEEQGAADRQLFQREIARDRELRERFQNRSPRPMKPDRQQP
jgi:hypothetical protein